MVGWGLFEDVCGWGEVRVGGGGMGWLGGERVCEDVMRLVVMRVCGRGVRGFGGECVCVCVCVCEGV